MAATNHERSLLSPVYQLKRSSLTLLCQNKINKYANLPMLKSLQTSFRKINNRLQVADVKDKEEAKEEYERAKSSGRTAGLVEQK